MVMQPQCGIQAIVTELFGNLAQVSWDSCRYGMYV
jgi:hypothetical protein